VQADFNTSSLDNCSTRDDLKRQGIELHEGMRCVFYDLDAEDGQSGFLHGEGVVWWDAKAGVFRHGVAAYQFTPGDNLAVLDAVYPDQDDRPE
jgi:hypothetical protein